MMEEMRRVKQFLDWHASWWDEQASRRDDLDPAQMEGVAGYARRQAMMRREMRDRFEAQWRYAADWVAVGEVPDDESGEVEGDEFEDVGRYTGDMSGDFMDIDS